jgi:ParB family transcriptional regulator, chromosome partitioning protein
MQVIEIPVVKIKEPEIEMRGTMTYEGIEELMSSIRENGLQQPITVVASGDAFEIVAGARRFESCKRLGLERVPCVLVVADSKKKEELKIHENLKREDVDPVEEGEYYNTLVEKRGFSVDDLMRATGRPGSYVEGRILLTRYDPQIKQALSSKQISLAVARELDRFKDSRAIGLYLSSCISGGATADTVKVWREQWLRDTGAAPVTDLCSPSGENPSGFVQAPILCHLCWHETEGKVTHYLPFHSQCYQQILNLREQPGDIADPLPND